MTDNDIIKALEVAHCNAMHGDCLKCPYLYEEDCAKKIPKDALDLINRQNAEKEALINGQEALQKYIAEQKAEIEMFSKSIRNLSITTEVQMRAENEFQRLQIERVKQARAEAITEFAERLKEKKWSERTCFGMRDFVEVIVIEQVARELKGEQ